MVESSRLQQELEGPFCQTWILLCTQLHSCVISKSKRFYSSYGKLESVRQRHFVQKQEIFIANKISVVVKDEEKAELFKRSHATIKKALFLKRNKYLDEVAKAGRHRNLNNFNYGTKTATSDLVFRVVTSPSPRKRLYLKLPNGSARRGFSTQEKGKIAWVSWQMSGNYGKVNL